MVQLGIFLDLFLVALGALAGGWVCKRLAVPEVLGYLGAGILLGPTTHRGGSFVDTDTIRAIGQFAVVFRMFLLGLDFDPRRLRGQWKPALSAGVLEMGLATLAGLGLAWLMGWPLIEGAVLGAALGTTSTSILAKALADRDMSGREDARAAGAATLAEDLIAMTMLAILTVFGTASSAGGAGIVENALWLLVFASLAFTAGALFVPIGLDRLGRSKSDELLTLAVIGILFAFAALSVGLRAGPALGAFLAGIAVGTARHAPGVSARVLPLRDMLVPVAYVGLGLMLDAGTVVRVAPLAIAIALVFVLLKSVAVTLGLRLGGVPTVVSARAGAILGQAGTMGLVFACGQAFHLEHLSYLLAIAFVAWAVTVGLTPLRLRYAPPMAERIARALGASDRIARSPRLPHRSDLVVRASLYSMFLAMGCSLALTALATLAARGDSAALSGIAQEGVTGLAAALAGFAALPFAIVAGVAGRRLLHARVHRAALGPRRLASSHPKERAWGHAGAAMGVILALAAPAAMLYALAPGDALLVLSVGFAAGILLACVRPSFLARLVEKCEHLTAPRKQELTPDLRLHDFRGLNPFGWEVDALLVRPQTAASWKTLRELAIPQKTGARVVAVLRPGTHDPAPLGPETLLHPGDEIVLGGGPNAIVNARRYLLEANPHDSTGSTSARSAAPASAARSP